MRGCHFRVPSRAPKNLENNCSDNSYGDSIYCKERAADSSLETVLGIDKGFAGKWHKIFSAGQAQDIHCRTGSGYSLQDRLNIFTAGQAQDSHCRTGSRYTLQVRLKIFTAGQAQDIHCGTGSRYSLQDRIDLQHQYQRQNNVRATASGSSLRNATYTVHTYMSTTASPCFSHSFKTIDSFSINRFSFYERTGFINSDNKRRLKTVHVSN